MEKKDRIAVASWIKESLDSLNAAIGRMDQAGGDSEEENILTQAFDMINGVFGEYEECLEKTTRMITGTIVQVYQGEALTKQDFVANGEEKWENIYGEPIERPMPPYAVPALLQRPK